MIKPRWEITPTDEIQLLSLMRDYGITKAIAQVILNRQILLQNLESFLHPQLKDLSDPFLIPGIEVAVKRIWEAIIHGERILIFGDYDTDGITATVLLSWVLRENGADVDCYIPHRLDDGYGLTVDSIDKAINDHKLIITVDCGITSWEATDVAISKGVDVIITDHHQPGERLPQAYAIINPKLHPHIQDLHILAGVGVSFKLCHAMIKFGREQQLGGLELDLKEGLDLVALGTVADIVPLLGENRCLVKHGLKVLKSQRRPGLRALCEIARIEDRMNTKDISFRLAPRINAAGRLGQAGNALKLLQTDSMEDAHPLARELEGYNRKRQVYEDKIMKVASERIQQMNLTEKYSIVVAEREWHPGVIGIVASRLTQLYLRPALVLSIQENGDIMGSGRSLADLNLIDLLSSCKVFLVRFGGHPMAAGLTLTEANLASFTAAFEAAVKETCLSRPELTFPLTLDGDVTIAEMTEQFFHELESLQPFGCGNMQPIFRYRNVKPKQIESSGKNHTRGLLCDDQGNQICFFAFGKNPQDFPVSPWNVAGTPEINYFNNNSYPQIKVVAVERSS